MKEVELFFDFSSPYSYLASTQIEAIAARHGATLRWRPMVLGAVFKATGNTMPASVAAKAAWMFADLDRWAAQYGVPFRFNSRFPINAIGAMRLVCFAEAAGRAAAVVHAAFHAVWAEDRDVAAEPELRAIAAAAQLDPDQALAAIATPAIKDQLRAHTDEAVRRGVFGAPTLIIGERLFWGNDRLHFVEAALAE